MYPTATKSHKIWHINSKQVPLQAQPVLKGEGQFFCSGLAYCTPTTCKRVRGIVIFFEHWQHRQQFPSVQQLAAWTQGPWKRCAMQLPTVPTIPQTQSAYGSSEWNAISNTGTSKLVATGGARPRLTRSGMIEFSPTRRVPSKTARVVGRSDSLWSPPGPWHAATACACPQMQLAVWPATPGPPAACICSGRAQAAGVGQTVADVGAKCKAGAGKMTGHMPPPIRSLRSSIWGEPIGQIGSDLRRTPEARARLHSRQSGRSSRSSHTPRPNIDSQQNLDSCNGEFFGGGAGTPDPQRSRHGSMSQRQLRQEGFCDLGSPPRIKAPGH
jgi:hypothetical protein